MNGNIMKFAERILRSIDFVPERKIGSLERLSTLMKIRNFDSTFTYEKEWNLIQSLISYNYISPLTEKDIFDENDQEIVHFLDLIPQSQTFILPIDSQPAEVLSKGLNRTLDAKGTFDEWIQFPNVSSQIYLVSLFADYFSPQSKSYFSISIETRMRASFFTSIYVIGEIFEVGIENISSLMLCNSNDPTSAPFILKSPSLFPLINPNKSVVNEILYEFLKPECSVLDSVDFSPKTSSILYRMSSENLRMPINLAQNFIEELEKQIHSSIQKRYKFNEEYISCFEIGIIPSKFNGKLPTKLPSKSEIFSYKDKTLVLDLCIFHNILSISDLPQTQSLWNLSQHAFLFDETRELLARKYNWEHNYMKDLLCGKEISIFPAIIDQLFQQKRGQDKILAFILENMDSKLVAEKLTPRFNQIVKVIQSKILVRTVYKIFAMENLNEQKEKLITKALIFFPDDEEIISSCFNSGSSQLYQFAVSRNIDPMKYLQHLNSNSLEIYKTIIENLIIDEIQTETIKTDWNECENHEIPSLFCVTCGKSVCSQCAKRFHSFHQFEPNCEANSLCEFLENKRISSNDLCSLMTSFVRSFGSQDEFLDLPPEVEFWENTFDSNGQVNIHISSEALEPGSFSITRGSKVKSITMQLLSPNLSVAALIFTIEENSVESVTAESCIYPVKDGKCIVPFYNEDTTSAEITCKGKVLKLQSSRIILREKSSREKMSSTLRLQKLISQASFVPDEVDSTIFKNLVELKGGKYVQVLIDRIINQTNPRKLLETFMNCEISQNLQPQICRMFNLLPNEEKKENYSEFWKKMQTETCDWSLLMSAFIE